MEENKVGSIVSIIAVVILAIFGVTAIQNTATVSQKATQSNVEALGTDLTVNASNGSYTEELRRNFQAVAEKMAGLTPGQILQADSQGRMQPVTATGLTGDFTFASNTRAASFVQTGSIATFTASSTATAAQVCDNPHWMVTPVTTTPTITLPATTTLFADCFTTIGDIHEFSVEAITTSTIIGIGSGGNLDLSSTATITANKSAILRIIRNSATTYLAIIINANS